MRRTSHEQANESSSVSYGLASLHSARFPASAPKCRSPRNYARPPTNPEPHQKEDRPATGRTQTPHPRSRGPPRDRAPTLRRRASPRETEPHPERPNTPPWTAHTPVPIGRQAGYPKNLSAPPRRTAPRDPQEPNIPLQKARHPTSADQHPNTARNQAGRPPRIWPPLQQNRTRMPAGTEQPAPEPGCHLDEPHPCAKPRLDIVIEARYPDGGSVARTGRDLAARTGTG